MSAVFPSITPAEAKDFRFDLNIFDPVRTLLRFSQNVAFLRNELGFYSNQFRAKKPSSNQGAVFKGTKMQNEPKFSHFDFCHAHTLDIKLKFEILETNF